MRRRQGVRGSSRKRGVCARCPFCSLAKRVKSARSADARVDLQEAIAAQNRRGILSNYQAEQLLDMMR
jgi:hypothetical protein